MEESPANLKMAAPRKNTSREHFVQDIGHLDLAWTTAQSDPRLQGGMFAFIARRLGVIALTTLCKTRVVFCLVNLEPSLKRLAISQREPRTSAEQLEGWLVKKVGRTSWCATASGLLWCKSNLTPTLRPAKPRGAPLALLIGTLAGYARGDADRPKFVGRRDHHDGEPPKYVSDVILTVIFALWRGWLNGSAPRRHCRA